MKLSRSTPAVKRLLAATFPEYRGRTIQLVATERVHGLENYWDGGTRSYWKAVDLATGRVVDPAVATTNPFTKVAHATVELPAGVALVEHTIFCGTDVGVTIHVRPGTVTAALTGSLALALNAAPEGGH